MSERDRSALRETAVTLARGAGALLREHFGRPLAVDYKGAVDLVTRADEESERWLTAEIRRRHPDHDLLAEEGGASPGRGGGARYRWIVDPLDGTTNFAHAYPFYAVSIAVEEAEPGRETAPGRRGPVVAAAVYDPDRDEAWSASLGGGANLDGTRIRVSEVDRLERALVATGFPYDVNERPEESLAHFAAFLPRTQAIRRDGSAALNLCYLACGRFDAFWEIKLHAWDTAAGTLVIREAGGMVSDFRGGAFDPFGPECAASNGRLHPELLEVLAGLPRPEPLPPRKAPSGDRGRAGRSGSD